MTMGGYVEQAYTQLYPDRLAGFISIDSAPLQRNYVTAVEIWLLKRMEPVYAHYPWKLLLKSGTEGVAASNYGRNLMKEMMLVYDGDHPRRWKETDNGRNTPAIPENYRSGKGSWRPSFTWSDRGFKRYLCRSSDGCGRPL